MEFLDGESVFVEVFKMSELDLDFMLASACDFEADVLTEGSETFRFLEAPFPVSAKTISLGRLTPVELMGGFDPELTFFIGALGGSEVFFEGGFGGRAVVNDLRLVSLLLVILPPALSLRPMVGDFLTEEGAEVAKFFLEPEALASFEAVELSVMPGLDLAFTALSNAGGEVTGDAGESSVTSILDCRETGEVRSKTELDLNSSGRDGSGSSLLLRLLLEFFGVAILFSFFSTSARRFSMLMFKLDDSAALLSEGRGASESGTYRKELLVFGDGDGRGDSDRDRPTRRRFLVLGVPGALKSSPSD